MIWTLLRTLISTLNTHRLLALENLALRQQIAILQRGSRRPFFTDTGCFFREVLLIASSSLGKHDLTWIPGLC